MNRSTLLLSVLSGLLLVLSFPTFNLSLAAWFGLVPLLMALARTRSIRAGFLLGGAWGLVFFGGTVFWVTNSIYHYGGIPLVPASLLTLLLCAYLALYPALFGASIVFVRSAAPRLAFIATPLLWTALEFARTYVFTGFPWALLGYSQHGVHPVIQIADLTGVYGVSFLIVLVNAAIADVAADRRKFIAVAAAGATVTIVLLYGLARLHTSPAAETVRIAVVQGNIEQHKKWDIAYQDEVVAAYRRLTTEAIESRPDLIVWPETATPFYFGGGGRHDDLSRDLLAFVKSAGVPLLFGTPTYDVLPGRVVTLRNSAYLVSEDGEVRSVYHKMHLVPFGEYVPLKSILFFVEKVVDAVGDFRSGTEHTVMTLPLRREDGPRDLRLSTVICYEIIFPDLVRRFVRNGAQVMTTITNDAWFGRTPAPYQHFSMAVFRAVENRVAVARAANTGVSGFIDTRGRVLASTELFREAWEAHDLPVGGERTFYTTHGDVFAYLCVLGAAGIYGGAARAARQAASINPGRGRRRRGMAPAKARKSSR